MSNLVHNLLNSNNNLNDLYYQFKTLICNTEIQKLFLKYPLKKNTHNLFKTKLNSKKEIP